MKKRGMIFSLLLGAFCVQAEVQPAGIFTDGTILQQNEPVRIWGTANPGEKVTVSFAGQNQLAETSDKGKWQVVLDPMPATATPGTLQISGSESKVTFSDILIGEVWLAGGQSNMATTMEYYKKTTQADIDGAQDPLLRMVTIPRLEYAGQNQNRPQWNTSRPELVKNFSATAYYFAKNLREQLDVPVGIISCNVGGTPAEAWMSRETLSSKPDLKRILDAYDTHVQTAFKDESDYIEKMAVYQQAWDAYWPTRNLEDKSKRLPRPKDVMGPRNYKRPCGLHENMLSQTIPYTVRGAIWYQGENNAGVQAGRHYRSVFSTLIEEWREEFQNPELPFLFVQLATLGWGESSHWPELRDAQKWVDENVPHTGMAVLLDGGEKSNIHPHSKDIAGRRLSLLARNRVYGEKNLVCNGPRLESAQVKGPAIELTFSDTGSGLVLKPDGENTFELCGEDGNYVPATAKQIGKKIIVSAAEVPAPKHVRYGWRKWVVPTLYNAEGLPASPFRTDDFPMASAGRYYLDRLTCIN